MAITLQPQTRTTLAERLRTLLDEGDRAASALAATAGVNRTTFYKYRSRKYPAPKVVASLVALADEFGVSLDWLLGRTEVRAVNGQPPPPRTPPPPCQACAEAAGFRSEHLALQAERDDLRAQLAEAQKHGKARHDPTKPGRPHEPAEAAEVRERTAALLAAKIAKHASTGRENLGREEIDAVLDFGGHAACRPMVGADARELAS